MTLQNIGGAIGLILVFGLIAYLPTIFSGRTLFVAGLLCAGFGLIGIYLGVHYGSAIAQAPWAISLWSYICISAALAGPILLMAAVSGRLRLRRRSREQ